jgi:hypothetical protein
LLLLGMAVPEQAKGAGGATCAVLTTVGESMLPVENPVRFGPERTVLAVVVIMAVGALPLAASSPYLLPVLVVPVLAGLWVWRARVVATPSGFEVCNGLGVRRFAWDDVATFQIPTHGPIRMKPTKGRSVVLTALPKLELSRFLEVGTP